MRRWLMMAAAMLATGAPADAQWRELTVGSEAERYVRAMQTRGEWGGEPASIRGYGPKVLDRWIADSLPRHPWAPRFVDDSLWIWPLRPSMSMSVNSAYPWGYNDGAVWQGKGATFVATAGFGMQWRWFSLRVEPVAFRAENGDFAMLGDTTRGINPFVDQQRPGSIDLPQRFERASYQRVDPGESELRIDAGPVAVGFSTMNRFWGPGIRHSLLMTGNAGGFPHLFLGTSRALRTRAGRIAGQLVYGKLSPSGYHPDASTPDRFGSGLAFSWQPPKGTGFEFGVARFYHREWPAGGLKVGDLTVPFGSLFEDFQTFKGGPADNQLITFFARWRAEDDGFEFFGEFGRNDRSGSARDLALEPEHNSAWLLGFAKTLKPRDAALWMVRGEYANARITALQQLGRGQATFYEHSPITQGHTSRGQLLGSMLAERSGGFEFGVDRWTSRSRLGLTIVQRTMPDNLAEGAELTTARSQWYTAVSAVRLFGRHELFGTVGVVFDINRRPGRDEADAHTQLGVRLALPR